MAVHPSLHGTPMHPSFAQMGFSLQSATAAVVLAVAVSAAGCASLPPPTAELEAARAAVARADAADAVQYAQDDFGLAGAALSQAQAAMSAGRESDARKLALLAAARGDLATAKSRQAGAEAELAQRRAEVTELRRRLDPQGAGR